MGEKNKEKKKSLREHLRSKKVVVPIITIFAFALLYTGSFVFLNIVYADKVFPWVKVAGVSVGGKTKEETAKTLEQKTIDIIQKGVTVKEGENTFTIKVADIGLYFDNEKTGTRAAELNKMNYNLLDLYKQNLPLSYVVNDDLLEEKIAENLAKINTPATDSKIVINKDTLTFTDEKDGEGVDGDKLKTSIKSALDQGSVELTATREILKPKITKEVLEGNRKTVEDFLSENLVLTDGKKTFEVKKEVLAGWIAPKNENGKIVIVLGTEEISAYLKTLEPRINSNAVNAQLNISGGKATAFALSKDGRKLDIPESAKKIAEEATGSKNIELMVKVTKAEVNEGNMGDFGIKELVATGYSDFKGSPVNRIHNVKTGASKFNGVLIKPDENFSFNKALGAVDASTGFLEELVILQNKTVPQFGGGLCQVSSTAFRAALNAGLPITARTAHAYPVQYYKPYGVDATIYLPNPDLKFTNDTSHYILIQTRIEGTKLYFDFYGTKKIESLKFAGNAEGTGGVSLVEQVSSYIFNQEVKGRGSFDTIFYRLSYNAKGELVKRDKFTSKYDSPDKYPH